MYEHTSRYYALETATLTGPDGRAVAYTRRRFLPAGRTMPTLVEIAPGPGDRLDLIAARTLGDPEQFWRICDANNVLDPAELLDEPDSTIRVPIPQP
jgi:hypothetical protein